MAKDKHQLRKIEDAWLGLDIEDHHVFNPMSIVDFNEKDFHLKLAWLLSRPEYFSFLCKHILNIQILPSQALFLHEMWHRKFPMLIASRGFGKALTPDTPVRVKNGWKPIKDLDIGEQVYASNGTLCNVTAKTPIHEGEYYRINFKDGRSIECCEDHKWVVYRKSSEQTEEVDTKDIIKNYKSRRYSIPVCKGLINEEEQDLPINPFLLGVIISKGRVSRKTTTLSIKDEDEILDLEKMLPEGYAFKSKGGAVEICAAPNVRPFYQFIEEHIGSISPSAQSIPEVYKRSSFAHRIDLFYGLFRGRSLFNTVSKKLSEDICDIARSLGFYCSAHKREVVVNGKKYNDCYTINVNQKDRVAITSVEYVGRKEGLCITVDSKDHTYITKDYIVTHNSFMLALYSVIRALLLPKRKVVIVGSAFRQSKVIFEYMSTIWNNAPILRDICDQSSGPRVSIDKCVMKLNESTITALPLGNGDKIRGQRANEIIADEFACARVDSLVETTDGLIRIQDFDNADTMMPTGDSSVSYEKPTKFIKTPLTDVYEVKLRNGYTICCSNIHQVMTNKGWKIAKDLQPGDWVEEANYQREQFSFGNDQTIDEKTAWLLGILVSEGHVKNRNRLGITTTDERVKKKLEGDYGFNSYERGAYTDSRGWVCKKSWSLYKDDIKLRKLFYEYGLDYVTAHDKKIPSLILRSPKSVIIAFLSGLFDGDGTCFLWKDRDIDNKIGLAYYSVSERLCRDVQVLMRKLGYDGYINHRESKISENRQWMVRWNGRHAKDAAIELNVPRFKETVDKCVVSSEPTYVFYDNSRGLWCSDIPMCGKNERKRWSSRDEAEEYVRLSKNLPKYRKVVSVTKLPEQEHLYDYFLPKTNSFFAEGFRQHNSIPRDIFETVVAGFAAVSSDPVGNVKLKAAKKKAEELGIVSEEEEETFVQQSKDNQIIVAGTAYYDFNHFAAYWKRWKAIINSKGDHNRLREIFGGEDAPRDFDWRDYSIIRMPYELLPDGFMDASQVARSKASVHAGIYQMEFGAVFTRDSQGFFKRSLIESCVCSETNAVKDSQGHDIVFEARLMGERGKKYVFGVDPASEVDNFSIIVLELAEDHRKIVHCWTTNRGEHRDKIKKGLCKETDFYAYCARKIRDLMKLFPCVHIAMDAQGGGIAVMESLHDKDKVEPGEHPIWPVIDDEKPKDTDGERGLHILEMCQFAKYDWLAEANHGMRKDFEDKVLLFPVFDGLTLGLSSIEDELKGRSFDNLEQCVMDIEELKDELSMIQITQTQNGRERWDTPEVIVGTGKKSRSRKDRYSALLMANAAGRTIMRKQAPVDYVFYGGFAAVADKDNKNQSGDLFTGPSWYTDNMKDVY